uniref:Uncharacterized protein n=1 Tax=Zea mays TaxID=4577 RepID=B6SY56_MAIZE|nr:hypothetical protein [Zea mays]
MEMHCIIHFRFFDIIHSIRVSLLFFIKSGDYIDQNISSADIIICCQLTDHSLCLLNMIEIVNSKMLNT